MVCEARNKRWFSNYFEPAQLELQFRGRKRTPLEGGQALDEPEGGHGADQVVAERGDRCRSGHLDAAKQRERGTGCSDKRELARLVADLDVLPEIVVAPSRNAR